MSSTHFKYFPDIDSDKFYEDIYTKKEYYINRKQYINSQGDGPDDQCDRENQEFELLAHQKLLKNYISPLAPYRNLLVFHGLGTGKTCTAITIAESFKDYIRKIRETTNKKPFIYIIAASEAENNFKKELMGSCPPVPYVTDEERERLNTLRQLKSKEGRAQYLLYKKSLESRLTDPNKGGYYKFMGYRKFQNKTIGAKMRAENRRLIKRDQGEIWRKTSKDPVSNLDNSILIIDEAHNIEANDYGKAIEFVIESSKNLRVILLTATPMKNKPTEIVQFMNFVLPKDKKLKRREIFDGEELKPDGLKTLQERTKGYVSYLRGYNPYTFPQRVEMGEINKKEGFKFTKLVRCVLTGFHLDTYNEEYDNKMSKENQHLFDMVLPNPVDSKIGIYKTVDINTLIKDASVTWLTQHGIVPILDPKTKTDIIISGPILELDNLKKYSIKFYTLVQNLWKTLEPKSGAIFIFNRWTNGIGLKLLEQILLRNGFDVYNSSMSVEENQTNYHSGTKCVTCGKVNNDGHGKDHEFFPAKVAMLSGDIRSSERNRLVALINDPDNYDGRIIKIILGSDVTKESVDFKRVREVHVINVQDDIPTLEQIIGRAIRHCSHAGLPKKERIVKVFKYATALPEGLSGEELKYLYEEKNHLVMKQIERSLKVSAMDCALNKYENIFEEEVKKYQNCDNDKQLCPMLCDYMPCDYKCAWEPKDAEKVRDNIIKRFRNLSIDDLNTDTYRIGFYGPEVKEIIKIIQELYKYGIFFTIENILGFVHSKHEKLLEDRYVFIAIDRMIKDQIPFRNIYNQLGRLIYRGNYYIFQPLEIKDESIPLFQRFIPIKESVEYEVPINDYIAETIKDVRGKGEQIEDVIESIKKTKDRSEIAKILGKISIEDQQKILEKAINNLGKNPVYQKIIDYFRDYLITFQQLDASSYFTSITTSTTKGDEGEVKTVKEHEIVGHLLGKNPRCVSDSGVWENCIRDFSQKRKEWVENDIVIGFIDKNRSNELVFKLRPRIDKDVKEADRRKIQIGFVCNRSSEKNKIIEYAKKLGIKDIDKTSIYTICEQIENKLRQLEAKEREKGSNIKWFYEYLEIMDNREGNLI